MTTVLVTGAAGRIGRYLRASLPGLGFRLRLLDLEAIPDEPDAVRGDINDEEAMRKAVDGVDAVVHLAGVIHPADPFEIVLSANIAGTYRVFESARLAGVERLVFASSNHANGFTPRAAGSSREGGDRPDSFYGVSKLFGESLGRYYHDRYGMKVACLTAPHLGYAVLYGVSRNHRRYWDLAPAEALGYEPFDDAEIYAGEILAEQGGIDPSTPDEPQGGKGVRPWSNS